MKISITYIIIFILFATLFSCKKDNYDPPSNLVEGNLAYNGDLIGLENRQVSFELHQSGFSTPAPITGTFDQTGKLSMLLFPGVYKLVVPNNQGPFIWKRSASGNPDTLDIQVNGNTQIELPVIPYFMIRGVQMSAANNAVASTFNVEQIVTGADAKRIQFVGLYINKTQFVSQLGTENIAQATLSDIPDPGHISLSAAIPEINPAQNYVFARIGLKIEGVEDMIYSPLQKLSY